MKAKDKVAVGIVNDGTINSSLVIDLLTIQRQRALRFDSLLQVENIGLLTRSRNVIVKNYLEHTDAQWLLMMDSDERLTLETFDKLIEAANDAQRPVVSGLVFAAFFDNSGNLRPVPTIYQDGQDGLTPIDAYPLDEVIKIDAAGTGCLLVHRSVFEKIRDAATEHQGPDWCWFFDGAIGGRWLSEDLLFSKRLASIGIPMHAHTGATCAHRKQFWLDHRYHAMTRDAAIRSTEKA